MLKLSNKLTPVFAAILLLFVFGMQLRAAVAGSLSAAQMQPILTLLLFDKSSYQFRVGYKFVGEDEYDYSGQSVSSAGDVDGDGNDDLLIGADNADDGAGARSGSSYLIYGDDLAAMDAADGSTDGVISLANVYKKYK